MDQNNETNEPSQPKPDETKPVETKVEKEPSKMIKDRRAECDAIRPEYTRLLDLLEKTYKMQIKAIGDRVSNGVRLTYAWHISPNTISQYRNPNRWGKGMLMIFPLLKEIVGENKAQAKPVTKPAPTTQLELPAAAEAYTLIADARLGDLPSAQDAFDNIEGIWTRVVQKILAAQAKKELTTEVEKLSPSLVEALKRKGYLVTQGIASTVVSWNKHT